MAQLRLVGGIATMLVFSGLMLPQSAHAATIRVQGVWASGTECASPGQDPNTCDWFVSGTTLVLHRGGQDIQVEVFISDWDPGQANGTEIATYQVTLGCDSFQSNTGHTLVPTNTQCSTTFDAACLGVDEDRLDYIFAPLTTTIPACQVVEQCPNMDPGHYACGAVTLNLNGVTDPGVEQYAASFAAAIPEGVAGSWNLSLDSDPNATLLRDIVAQVVDIDEVIPALITVRCSMDAQCDDNDPCTVDSCNALFGVCNNNLIPVDAAVFASCLTGPEPTSLSGTCAAYDADDDDDVDLQDAAAFANTFECGL